MVRCSYLISCVAFQAKLQKKGICRTKRNKSFGNVVENFANGVDYNQSHSAKFSFLAVGSFMSFYHLWFKVIMM